MPLLLPFRCRFRCCRFDAAVAVAAVISLSSIVVVGSIDLISFFHCQLVLLLSRWQRRRSVRATAGITIADRLVQEALCQRSDDVVLAAGHHDFRVGLVADVAELVEILNRIFNPLKNKVGHMLVGLAIVSLWDRSI